MGGDVFQSLGYGLIGPYLALYLTNTIGLSPALAGILLAAFTIGSLVGTPLGGVLSDRIGRRPVMIVGLVGSGIAAIAFGLASGAWPVAILIVAWGVFASLFDPAASAYIADVVRSELRTEAYGIKRLVNNAAFALGVPLGALLIFVVSIRASFVASGIAVLIYVAIIVTALPESRVLRRDDTEAPARFREGFRDRALMLLVVASFLSYTLFSVYEGSLPVFLNMERGLAVAAWGALFAINPILITIFQYPVSRWAGRRNPRIMLALGALLYGVSLAVLIPSADVWVIAIALCVFTFGEMISEPVIAAVAAKIAPARLRGTYQSFVALSLELAWAPASIVGLWLIGQGRGEILLVSAVPIAAASAAIYLSMPRIEAAEELSPKEGDPATRIDPLRPPH